MRISTKKGDQGETSLLYGGRVPKSDPRTEAYGSIDEAVSALGLARALVNNGQVRDIVYHIQKGLFVVGAELATSPEQYHRLKDGYTRVTEEMVRRLEEWIEGFEGRMGPARDFITPGATAGGGALDLARAVVRRAERRAVALREQGMLTNEAVLKYLNRLSDLIWLLARWEEADAGEQAQGRGPYPATS